MKKIIAFIMALMIVGLAGCSAAEIYSSGSSVGNLLKGLGSGVGSALKGADGLQNSRNNNQGNRQASVCDVGYGNRCPLGSPIPVGAGCYCLDSYSGRRINGIAR